MQVAIPLLPWLSLSFDQPLHMKCECFGTMLRLHWWRRLGSPGWLHIDSAMTTNDDTSNKKLQLFFNKKTLEHIFPRKGTLVRSVQAWKEVFMQKENTLLFYTNYNNITNQRILIRSSRKTLIFSTNDHRLYILLTRAILKLKLLFTYIKHFLLFMRPKLTFLHQPLNPTQKNTFWHENFKTPKENS